MADTTDAKVEVIITVAEERRGDLSQIASELATLGLELTGEPLQGLGLICGKATEGKLDQLRTVNGVSDLEKAGSVQIAPPESDLQ